MQVLFWYRQILNIKRTRIGIGVKKKPDRAILNVNALELP